MDIDLEVDLLNRLLEPVTSCLSLEAARRLVAIKADPSLQARMDELADKANQGNLAEDERNEYETYVSAANVLAILQSKARQLLTTSAA